MANFLLENLCLNVCFLSILWAFCASNGHEQKPPFYCRLPFIYRGCLNLFYVVKCKAPEFLSKLRESEKVETMGAHRPTATRCVFRAVGSARAQRRGRCRVGAVRCVGVFRRGRRQGGVQGPQ